MDFLKKAADRAQQSVTETIGTAAKTEYSSETTALLARADEIRAHTAQLIHALENYVQPDPALKIMNNLTGDALTKGQQLGNHLKTFGEKLDSWKHTAAPAFHESAKAFTAIGQSEKNMYTSMSDSLAPLKAVLGNDIRLLDEERKTLTNNRLDMDTLKNKKNAPADQVAKAENTFQAQQQKVCGLVNNLEVKLSEYRTYLKSLVAVDLAHYRQCANALEQLDKTL